MRKKTNQDVKVRMEDLRHAVYVRVQRETDRDVELNFRKHLRQVSQIVGCDDVAIFASYSAFRKYRSREMKLEREAGQNVTENGFFEPESPKEWEFLVYSRGGELHGITIVTRDSDRKHGRMNERDMVVREEEGEFMRRVVDIVNHYAEKGGKKMTLAELRAQITPEEKSRRLKKVVEEVRKANANRDQEFQNELASDSQTN